MSPSGESRPAVTVRWLSRLATVGTRERTALWALAFFVLLFARRWQQLISPQVWDEDGSAVLRGFIDVGYSTVFDPLAGYLVGVARFISLAAFAISPVYYPILSTIFAWLFIVLVAVAIAVAPIRIRGGPLLAFATLLVPSDPEVFGLPLYTFWWAGLLIVLATLWERGAGAQRWRNAFVVIGGLSSPVILLAWPLFAYRLIVDRTSRAERWTFAFASICVAIQIAVLRSQHVAPEKSLLDLGNVLTAQSVFLGNYILGNLARANAGLHAIVLALAGFATLAFVVVAVREERQSFESLLCLLYLWFGSIALSAARVSVSILDPVGGGPRYFFYPFVFEGWFLVHIACTARRPAIRITATAFLALGCLTALPILSRSQDDLSWTASLGQCTVIGDTQPYRLPVQYDGNSSSSWSLAITGARCRELVARDAIVRLIPSLRPEALFVAIPVEAGHIDTTTIASTAAIEKNSWLGSDFQRSHPSGLTVIGSWRNSDADTGILQLQLHRGDRVLFRTGPGDAGQRIDIADETNTWTQHLPVTATPDWTILEFSGPRLPDRFTVTFEDNGTTLGEWSAVALARRP